MATNDRRPAIHPLRFVAGTVVYTMLGAGVVGVATAVLFGVAHRLGPPYPHLYVASLLGLSLVLSMELFKEDVVEEGTAFEYEELTLSMKLLVFVFAIILYNILLFASLFVVALSLELGAGRFAYLVAFLYPAYDLKTGAELNPVSVLGLVGWILTFFSLIGWISQSLVDVVRDVELEPFRFIESVRYRRPG